MKLDPVHVVGGIIIAILMICLVISYTRSAYDAGGAGTGGQSATDKGNLIVYGSKTCPWCVKQEQYLTGKGIDYTFVNCPTETCPEFVKGFPTLMLNGEVKNGYTEI